MYGDVCLRTRLQQEAVVTVRGVPLCSRMESLVTDTISANAGKVGNFFILYGTDTDDDRTQISDMFILSLASLLVCQFISYLSTVLNYLLREIRV